MYGIQRTVDRATLCRRLPKIGIKATKKETRVLFKLIDLDSSGQITLQELQVHHSPAFLYVSQYSKGGSEMIADPIAAATPPHYFHHPLRTPR